MKITRDAENVDLARLSALFNTSLTVAISSPLTIGNATRPARAAQIRWNVPPRLARAIQPPADLP